MSVTMLSAALLCLSMNVFHEAKNQSVEGQIAVAEVVMNRVADTRYPNTVCEVVYQGPTRESWKTKKQKDLPKYKRIYYPIRDRSQFSWYCDGKTDDIPKYDHNAWQIATWVANGVLHGKLKPITKGATHYHADYVLPEWAETKTKTKVIGNHIFYRWEK